MSLSDGLTGTICGIEIQEGVWNQIIANDHNIVPSKYIHASERKTQMQLIRNNAGAHQSWRIRRRRRRKGGKEEALCTSVAWSASHCRRGWLPRSRICWQAPTAARYTRSPITQRLLFIKDGNRLRKDTYALYTVIEINSIYYQRLKLAVHNEWNKTARKTCRIFQLWSRAKAKHAVTRSDSLSVRFSEYQEMSRWLGVTPACWVNMIQSTFNSRSRQYSSTVHRGVSRRYKLFSITAEKSRCS